MSALPLETALFRYLGWHGPAPAGELRKVLGVSQPTFSRLLSRVREKILVVGRARATWYAARRTIPGLPSSLPLYEIGPSRGERVCTLHPVQPKGFYCESKTGVAGFYEDLPWFLHDLRPAGALGRLVPRHHPELALPPDVRNWHGDVVLQYLHAVGSDLPGNLIVGEPAFQRSLELPPANLLLRSERSERYAVLAAQVMSHGVAGSSAGGEQPKFLATRLENSTSPQGTPVLVKFSPPLCDATSRRVADLLCCEHLALRRVAATGRAVARSEVIRGGDRCFLEVERFDRVPAPGWTGRRGVVSLTAVAAALDAAPDDWSQASVDLHAGGHIDAPTRDEILWLDRFGRWIGNTDRHAGNLSFHLERGVLGGLTPLYDMLPMGYAPRSGEIVPYELPLPRLTPLRAGLWVDSWRAAVGFWEEVAEAGEVSAAFREIATRNVEKLRGWDVLLGRLPTG